MIVARGTRACYIYTKLAKRYLNEQQVFVSSFRRHAFRRGRNLFAFLYLIYLEGARIYIYNSARLLAGLPAEKGEDALRFYHRSYRYIQQNFNNTDSYKSAVGCE